MTQTQQVSAQKLEILYMIARKPPGYRNLRQQEFLEKYNSLCKGETSKGALNLLLGFSAASQVPKSSFDLAQHMQDRANKDPEVTNNYPQGFTFPINANG